MGLAERGKTSRKLRKERRNKQKKVRGIKKAKVTSRARRSDDIFNCPPFCFRVTGLCMGTVRYVTCANNSFPSYFCDVKTIRVPSLVTCPPVLPEGRPNPGLQYSLVPRPWGGGFEIIVKGLVKLVT